jgi:hypothetical protein
MARCRAGWVTAISTRHRRHPLEHLPTDGKRTQIAAFDHGAGNHSSCVWKCFSSGGIRQFSPWRSKGENASDHADQEKEGYVFKAAWRGGDYVYTVATWPEGARPALTKLDHIAEARRRVALFDAGAPAEEIFN